LKFLARQVLDQLRENGATDIHPPLFPCASATVGADPVSIALPGFQIVPAVNRAIHLIPIAL